METSNKEVSPWERAEKEFLQSRKNAGDETKQNNKTTSSIDQNTHIFLLICIIGISLAITLEILHVQNRRNKFVDTIDRPVKNYWVYSARLDVENKDGLLKHVHRVLDRIGYEKSTNETPWDLLWSHDYPFRVLFPNLHRLKPNQKVNHFPGTGYITNKVELATSDSKYIPKAFKLPQNKEDFMKYAEENPKSMFLQKHNQHRGVFLKNVSDVDFKSGESFVQEYVQKPFLVDGHKFDIGVYVAVTSVNPLRVYWYKGDVLFRYCPAKYYPLDPNNLDKYVVGDTYLPTWEVPSLAHPFTSLGFGMKDAFDVYVREQGKDPSIIWDEVQKAIAEIILKKEQHIIEALMNYPSADNFFEMMRFDLVIDEDLKVYLLEANMSPNLSAVHYPTNQLLYEQVLFHLFGLTGVASPLQHTRETPQSRYMESAQKNIAVYGVECSTTCKDRCEELDVCRLCRHCIGASLRHSLYRAHAETMRRGDFRRLYPPNMMPHKLNEEDLKGLTEVNKLQYLWYQGKCNMDATWCT